MPLNQITNYNQKQENVQAAEDASRLAWPFLEELGSQQFLPHLELALAEQILTGISPNLESVACFICHLSLASRQGHLCITIQDNKIQPEPIEIWPSPEDIAWEPKNIQKLETLICEGALLLPEALCADLQSSSLKTPGKPICKHNNNYYFQKSWINESQFLAHFQRLLSTTPSIQYDLPAIQQQAERFVQEKKLLPEQSKAILQACKNCLTIVCGGPGTGKTYTTAYIIQTLWQALPPESKENFEILLTAPTGKAASQLQKSLTKVLDKLDDMQPLTAKTLHSILEIKRHQHTSTCINLSADLIIVDECSMIDIKLMIKLLSSVKPGARLILLGDPFQLPPVESGGVFSDMLASLNNRPQLDYAPIFLHTCLRAELKGIISLAEWIKMGNSSAVLELTDPTKALPGIQLIDLDGAENKKSLQYIVEAACEHYSLEKISEATPEGMLAIFNRFKILTPLRKGLFGVDSLNRMIYQRLQQHSAKTPAVPAKKNHEPQNGAKDGSPGEGGPEGATRPWVNADLAGTAAKTQHYLIPIMIVSNHSGLNLFNGETGILVVKNKNVSPFSFQAGDYALFMDSQGISHKTVPAALLPRFELAYCLSIHKSQGSEFEQVLLIMPKGAEIFGRKAFYTGVTRAKRQLDILSTPQVLKETIDRCADRMSGVAARAFLV